MRTPCGNGREFTLIDTGGIDTQSEDVLLSQMRRQAEIAIETADLICFFIDVANRAHPSGSGDRQYSAPFPEACAAGGQ